MMTMLSATYLTVRAARSLTLRDIWAKHQLAECILKETLLCVLATPKDVGSLLPI